MTDLALLREDASASIVARVGQWAISVMCLIAPALINGAPLVYPDTRAYYLGGHTAVEKFLSVLHPASGAGGGGALAASIQKARGVRSAFYSLFTYLPAVSLSIWLVAVLQALLVTAMLRLVLRLLLPNLGGWTSTLLIAGLSLATTVSWVTSEIMPDIFTPIMVLAIATVLIYWNTLNSRAVAALWCAVSASLVMHITNLPIALGLVVVSLFICRPLFSRKAAYLVVTTAFAWSMVGMLAVSVVGFKQVTLTPQAPPFLLSRSIADGPGRLYLRAHCPAIGLDMCKHLDKLNQSPEEFMWSTDGVYSAVSPKEEGQLRAEGNHIFLAAAAEHPWMQSVAMVGNALAQLTSFGYYEYYIPSWADYSRDEMTLHLPGQAPWQTGLSIVGVVIIVFSLFVIYRESRVRAFSLQEGQFVGLMFAAVVLEALVGAISEPAPRYEARLIWLIPLTALVLSLRKIGAANHQLWDARR